MVQDLERAVDKLPPLDGVDAMAQNFFEEQAIKGMPCSHSSIHLKIAVREADVVKALISTTFAESYTTGMIPPASRSCKTSQLP